jgi:parallel beta-helix repeat protein
MLFRRATGVSASIVLTAAGSAVPAAAANATVNCGVPITHSVLLTADLECADGDALVIGADGITVDLGGHTVAAPRFGPYAGVRITGHDNVTIRNGNADGQHGVLLEEGANHNRILGVTVFGQVASIGIYDSRAALVRNNYSYVGSGYGLWLRHSGGSVIEGNRMAKENDDGNAHGGIRLTDGSSGNRIQHNIASSNGSDGIYVSAGSRQNVVAANTATWNTDDGIDIDDPDNTVSGNVTNENGGYGIKAVPGVRGAGNKAAGNHGPGECLNIDCS